MTYGKYADTLGEAMITSVSRTMICEWWNLARAGALDPMGKFWDSIITRDNAIIVGPQFHVDQSEKRKGCAPGSFPIRGVQFPFYFYWSEHPYDESKSLVSLAPPAIKYGWRKKTGYTAHVFPGMVEALIPNSHTFLYLGFFPGSLQWLDERIECCKKY
jgi:hypothetical protein